MKSIIKTSLLLTTFVVLALYGATLYNGSMVIVGTINYCESEEMSDSYACDLDPALPALVTGAKFSFLADVANTGAASLDLNSLGAEAIKKVVGGITTDLDDGDIEAGAHVDVTWDGVNFQMTSQLGNAPEGGGGGCEITSANRYWFPFRPAVDNPEWQLPANGALNTYFVRIIPECSSTWGNIRFNIVTGSGTCGGSGCAGKWCAFNDDGTVLDQCTVEITSGGSPDFNTTGLKTIAFTSSISTTAQEPFLLVFISNSSAHRFSSASAGVGTTWGTWLNTSTIKQIGWGDNPATGGVGNLTPPMTLGDLDNTASGNYTLPPAVLLLP